MRFRISLFASAAVIAIVTTVALYSQKKAEPSAPATPRAATFRISLGLKDTEPATWDGSLSLSGGQITRIEGWRFGGGDTTDGRSKWKAATRYLPPAPAAAQRQQQGQGAARGPILENGVLVSATGLGPDSRFDIETAQGKFSFLVKDAPFGESVGKLDGKVEIDRVPTTAQLTSSREDQDFPALAQSGDDVYLAYVEFVHGDRSKTVEGPLTSAPKDFDFLARPAGGDQVKLMHYSKSARTWSAPDNVTASGQDVMRAAIAIDGKKRVWVIWSGNHGGNFDLYAKSMEGGKWSQELRLTTNPGTDVNPVAATDSQGRVWVAWQAFRDNNLQILAAVQNGDRFTPETAVSASARSDWDPAIATASNGEVAVSWDTYDKGDYDVYVRRMRFDQGIKMDAPLPVAASQNFEARSSVAYDRQDRLWVAYENAEAKWGKDFGAYEKTGVSLYQGHNVAVKCLQGSSAFDTPGLREALATIPITGTARRPRNRQRQLARDSQLAAPAQPPNQQFPPGPRNSFPRLIVDSSGTVYLALRARSGERSPIGTNWDEYVTWFDGARWIDPVPVPHTDGLLDIRPALAVVAPGELLIVASSDHRRSFTPAALRSSGLKREEFVNSDLYSAEVQIESTSQTAALNLATVEVSGPQAEVAPELESIAQLRNYRVNLNGSELRLMRGEFHRHTEMSPDGGNDGPLIDAYRYLIDAASMDWGGCCDHDNGSGHEYFWWLQQKLTDAYNLGDRYLPMFAYERSVRYPEGHRNAVFAKRGIRPLPRLPKMADDSPSAPAPDTQMLYRYLKQFGGIVASHTSATDMGTDWRDNDPQVEPVVEIYQGDRQNYEMPDAPRSNKEGNSIGGWQPLGFVSLALQKGYRLGFQASSDHISTHMSYCNLWVTARTREAIMEAFRKRRIYGATDNILADVRSGEHFMGEEFSTAQPPSIAVKLVGTAAFAKVHIVKDGKYVYSIEPKTQRVEFVWRDGEAERGKTSYYYVRGEQSDGELVWVSPMWIKYQ